MNLRFIGGLGNSSKIPEGGRELWEVWGAGPASYNQTTADPVFGPAQGEHMSAPSGSVITLSGNYEVKPQPLGTNSLRPGWVFNWTFNNLNGAGVAKIVQNAAGTGMTPGTYPLTFAGGTAITPATGTVTVTATTVTAVAITNPGVYSVAPTGVTIGGTPGGTPATLTLTMSTPGIEVPNGANLSGESVQFMAAGGQY